MEARFFVQRCVDDLRMTGMINGLERLGELVSRSHGKSSALETTQKIGVKPKLINHSASAENLAI